LSVGETSRGIHGLSKITERNETEDYGVLRTPVPRKVLRRGADPWRALRKIERSTIRCEIFYLITTNDLFLKKHKKSSGIENPRNRPFFLINDIDIQQNIDF